MTNFKETATTKKAHTKKQWEQKLSNTSTVWLLKSLDSIDVTFNRNFLPFEVLIFSSWYQFSCKVYSVETSVVVKCQIVWNGETIYKTGRCNLFPFLWFLEAYINIQMKKTRLFTCIKFAILSSNVNRVWKMRRGANYNFTGQLVELN